MERVAQGIDFHIESPFSPETTLRRLRKLAREGSSIGQIAEELFEDSPEQSRPFIGTFDGTGFKIQKNAGGRNAFLPHIRGSVIAVEDGARVLVRRPSKMVSQHR